LPTSILLRADEVIELARWNVGSFGTFASRALQLLLKLSQTISNYTSFDDELLGNFWHASREDKPPASGKVPLNFSRSY
jgi:hypothetical protein